MTLLVLLATLVFPLLICLSFRSHVLYQQKPLDGIGDNTVVTEHIRRIRAKFLSLGDRPYIETVWGCGYKWKN